MTFINALQPAMAARSDEELKSFSGLLRRRYLDGESLDSLLVEAFALVREATLRKLGKFHYDVQLIGGMILHEGMVAEMATGEGKSLTGILPAYLNALTGQTVFIATVNDYLAKRDAELFTPVFAMLAMKVSPASAGIRTMPNTAPDEHSSRQQEYAHVPRSFSW